MTSNPTSEPKPHRAKRSHRLSIRVTPDLKCSLKKQWDYYNHPRTCRKFPNPLDPEHQIYFKSEQQFVEFILGCVCVMPKWAWYLFSNMLNPNFPKFDKKYEKLCPK